MQKGRFDDELLDQPLPTPADETVEPKPIFRYIITLVLFPMALVRLRTSGLNGLELVLGGLWSALQFLIAGLVFTIVRYWYRAKRGNPMPKTDFIGFSLQTAVEFIVVVGIGQLLWQYFYGG